MAKKSLEPKIIGLFHYAKLSQTMINFAVEWVYWKRDVEGKKSIGAAWVSSGACS